ncbi:MAG: GAF domain-containing protein [Anaerolineae bacterium]
MSTPTPPDFEDLLADIDALLERPLSRDEKLEALCALLRDQVPHYDWVGFYLVDSEAERELVLGPYVGAPTEHTRIPFGEGICGQAADTEQTFIVQDVSLETNYLSCSPDVRSEIVVPLVRDGEVLGELDIDSHALSPFTAQDHAFLEQVCHRVAPLL